MSSQLNELHFNGGLVGGILFATIGAALIGKVVNTKVRGTREQIDALANAILSSKRFQDELERPGATVESVIERLRVKQMSAQEFERVFDCDWPL